MKKFIIVILVFFLILGFCLTFLGTLKNDENILFSIGTSFLSSALVSIGLEIVNIASERKLLIKTRKLFFNPYRLIFFSFRDELPALHSNYLYDDNKARSFSEYIERLLDISQFSDGLVDEDIVFEIERYIMNLKNAIDSLISQENEMICDNYICSRMPLLKEQRKTCNRALGALRIGNYNNAVTYIIKLKNRHLEIFQELKDDFNTPYCDNDQGE